MSMPRFRRDSAGAAAVEIALLAPVFFSALFALVDFGLYFWRWNQAVEAARIGVRLAVVSDPVSSDLSTMTGLETGALAGQPVGEYVRVCAPSSCTGGGVYSAAAMARIFYGRGGAECSSGVSTAQAGMCDVLRSLALANVSVSYRASGVDVAGTAGALKPLVTVRITGAESKLAFVDALIPAFATLPDAEVTALAEDLRTAA
jgi:Flp pilus assembly protein TadG